MVSSASLQNARACDQCWSRKVKCGRSLPCPRCSRLSLECSYIRPRKKKGPSGKRGLIQLESLQSSDLTEDVVNFMRTPEVAIIMQNSSSALTVSLNNELVPSVTTGVGLTASDMLLQSDFFSSLFLHIPESLESELFSNEHDLSCSAPKSVKVDMRTMDSLVHSYAWRMSKFYPLVDCTSLLTRLQARENTQNPEFGALVHTICAFVLLEPVFKRDVVLQDKQTLCERAQLAQTLMDDAVAMRNMDPLFVERPSVDSILTSFFLFMCLDNRQLPLAAWLRLREAMTLAEIMEAQSRDDKTITVEEWWKRATLYRMLAVTEHAHAVARKYALSQNLLSRLQRSAFSTQHQSHLGAFGVTKLVSLYGVVDVDILDCWNGKCAASSANHCTNFTAERALNMHQLISEVYTEGNADDNLLGEDQIADIAISQQWLHNRVWTVCQSHGLLSEGDSPDGFRELNVGYAMDIARDTMRISKYFTMENFEVHGIGFIGKFYDIASSAVVGVSCYPSLWRTRIADSKLVPSDIEVLNQFIALLATFGGGQHPYLVPLMLAVAGLTSS
ncbi:hypothetical protein V1508DRAFT_427631 [Lipomyces doorenjongii]|uniref:uncharacterized protein n=1 Tax=Lipomyces doorenjongii TaxID=383834 RepID=UPI0034CDC6A2